MFFPFLMFLGFMATAYIVKWHRRQDIEACDIRVSLTFEQQRILSSTCSDCKGNIWCSHIIAAIIYRIRNPEKVGYWLAWNDYSQT